MDYRIEHSPEADRNGDEIYEWLASFSARYAGKWYVGLLKAIESLRRDPERCGYAPESQAIGRPIRQLLYGKRNNKYRILFEVGNQTVRILHIRHSARDWWRPD